MKAADGPLLNVKRVAELLGCSQANVYALIEDGELPYVSIGSAKGYRIDPEDLQSFVAARKTQRIQRRPKRKPPKPQLKHIRLN